MSSSSTRRSPIVVWLLTVLATLAVLAQKFAWLSITPLAALVAFLATRAAAFRKLRELT